MNMTLGQFVTKYPNATQVFNRYKVDYCCGGDRFLNQVVKEENLPQLFLEALKEVMTTQRKEEVTDWSEKSFSFIIDYILEEHHTFMRDTLDELNGLVFKILKVHYAIHSEQLLEIHHTFGLLKTELEAHLVKEEENLFPMIRAYEIEPSKALKEDILHYIQTTEDEHDAAGDLFKKLEEITNDFKAPEGACISYIRTFDLLNALEKDTFNHIHMENSVLFKKLEEA